jgi:hypothetical protein
MATRARVVPFFVKDALVHAILQRGAVGGQYVKTLVALKDSAFHRTQKLALGGVGALDEAARTGVLVASRGDEIAALMAAGVLDAGASHCKLLTSIDLVAAMLDLAARPLATSDKVRRAMVCDESGRNRRTSKCARRHGGTLKSDLGHRARRGARVSDAEQRSVLARAVRVECAAIRARNRVTEHINFAESCADSAPFSTRADSPRASWGGTDGCSCEDSAWISLVCSGWCARREGDMVIIKSLTLL